MLRCFTLAVACLFAPGPGSQPPLAAQPAPLPEQTEVTIVGAGLTGLTAAYRLAAASLRSIGIQPGTNPPDDAGPKLDQRPGHPTGSVGLGPMGSADFTAGGSSAQGYHDFPGEADRAGW